jgi:hypothetical protein
MTLRDKIKDHFVRIGNISPLEALGLYGCMDVSTVIRDLKRGNAARRPMNIKTELKKDNNGKVYARYHFGAKRVR